MDERRGTHFFPEKVKLVEALLRDPKHFRVEIDDVHDILRDRRHGRDDLGSNDADRETGSHSWELPVHVTLQRDPAGPQMNPFRGRKEQWRQRGKRMDRRKWRGFPDDNRRDIT